MKNFKLKDRKILICIRYLWPDLDPNQKVLLMFTYLDNPKGVDCEEQSFSTFSYPV